MHKKPFIIVMCILVTSIICCACSPQDKNVFVQYKSNGDGGYISGTAIQIIKYGENSSVVEAIPNEGYQFTKWSDERTDNPRNDSNIKRDLEIVAIFKKIPITLQYSTSSNYGKLEGAPIQNLEYGDNSSAVKAIPYEGFTFVKWSDDRTDNPRIDTNVKQDIDVEAIFREKEIFDVNYSAGENGNIEGVAKQNIYYGDNTTAVEAIPDEGYKFKIWSDGRTDNPRIDTDVKQDIDVEAIFEKIKTFALEYNYATRNTNQKKISIGQNDDLSQITLPVPQRVNSTFDGWYLDKDYQTQVADKDGKFVISKELLDASDSPILYAKFTTLQEVKYTILMVYVTEIDAELEFTESTPRYDAVDYLETYWEFTKSETKHFQYTMSKEERECCQKITQYFEEFLNTMFAGVITFEIDEYFTAKPLNAESFTSYYNYCNTKYAVFAENIPEISAETLSKYGSVLTTVNLEGIGEVARYNNNSACIDLDHFSPFIDDDDFLTPEPNQLSWTFTLHQYLHYFTHTVERQIYAGAEYENLYHDVLDECKSSFIDEYAYYNDYYKYTNSLMIEIRFNVMYLLGQIKGFNKTYGIPYDFWLGKLTGKR